MAAPIVPPAALARPQPRPRRRSLSGPSVATAISANRMDSVIVERYSAKPTATTPNATVTRTRQPMAARRLSQLGTSQEVDDGGGVSFAGVSKRAPSGSALTDSA